MSVRGKVLNQVRMFRATRGWSQHDLATRAGISRTEVSAIEVGRLVPSVATGLALARAFECRLDDLFRDEAAEAPAEWAWQPRDDRCRFWLADVAGRTLLFPAETAFPWAPPHDGVCEFGVLQFRSQVPAKRTLVLASCDPAAGLLAAEYARTTDHRLLIVPRSSGQALDLLAEGRVHLAGLHLHSENLADGNAAAARQRVKLPCSLLHVARWQEGVAVSRTAGIGSLQQALTGRLLWIGREPGSGARQCLDTLRPGRLLVRHIARDHRTVAESIRDGWADAGVCVRLVSEEAGLLFLPVQEESYDLCCLTAILADPRVKSLLEVLRSNSYRELLSELPGYDTGRTGEVRECGNAKD